MTVYEALKIIATMAEKHEGNEVYEKVADTLHIIANNSLYMFGSKDSSFSFGNAIINEVTE